MLKLLFAKLIRLNLIIYKVTYSFVTLWQLTRNVRMITGFSSCRFYPSCSDYFLQAIKLHGLLYGFYLTFKRLIKCHPLCEGGIDEVPHEGVNI